MLVGIGAYLHTIGLPSSFVLARVFAIGEGGAGRSDEITKEVPFAKVRRAIIHRERPSYFAIDVRLNDTSKCLEG